MRVKVEHCILLQVNRNLSCRLFLVHVVLLQFFLTFQSEITAGNAKNVVYVFGFNMYFRISNSFVHAFSVVKERNVSFLHSRNKIE